MRKALRETRDLHFSWHMLYRVERCRLPFYIWIRCDDYFFDSSLIEDTSKERLIRELVWHDSGDRRDRPTENMIKSAIDSCTLYREHIEIVFDETEDMCISLGIRAYLAILISHIHHTMASRAFGHIRMQIREGLREISHIRCVRLHEKKGKLRRSLLTYSRKIVDHVDESLQCLRQYSSGK